MTCPTCGGNPAPYERNDPFSPAYRLLHPVPQRKPWWTRLLARFR